MAQDPAPSASTGAITIRLAGAPVGKGRPRIGRAFNGQAVAFTPAKTRSYESQLKFHAQVVMGKSRPLEGPIAVHVEAAMPIPKSWSKRKQDAARIGAIRPITKPDWDNFAKTLDALNEVVWKDDSQVVEGSVHKIYSDRPALTVTVTPLAPQEIPQ